MRRALGRLTIRHLGWLNFKLVIGVAWPITLLTHTPASLIASLGWLVFLVASTTLAGALTSIVGLIMSAQTGAKAVVGLSVELAGLCLMVTGPTAYCLTYVYLCFAGFNGITGSQFVPGAVFAWAMVCALVCRILIVAPRRSQEAHDATKDA